MPVFQASHVTKNGQLGANDVVSIGESIHLQHRPWIYMSAHDDSDDDGGIDLSEMFPVSRDTITRCAKNKSLMHSILTGTSASTFSRAYDCNLYA